MRAWGPVTARVAREPPTGWHRPTCCRWLAYAQALKSTGSGSLAGSLGAGIPLRVRVDGAVKGASQRVDALVGPWADGHKAAASSVPTAVAELPRTCSLLSAMRLEGARSACIVVMTPVVRPSHP